MFRKTCSALILSLAASTAAIADDKPEVKLKRFERSSTSAVKELVAEVNEFLGDVKMNKEVLKQCNELVKRLDKCAKREEPKSPQREALNSAVKKIRAVADHEENDLPMLTNLGRKDLAEVAAALQSVSEKHNFADGDHVKKCAERAKELSEATACRVMNAQIIVSVKWGKIMVLVKYEDGDERKPRQLYMSGSVNDDKLKEADAEVLALLNRKDSDWDMVETNDESEVVLTWVLYHLK